MGACCSSEEEENNRDVEQRKKEDDDISDVGKIDNVMKEYQIGATLGSGASCRVVEGYDKSDESRKVAIKMMDKELKVAERLYKREVRILADLTPDTNNPHESILPFCGHGEDKNSYYILTSLLTGGEVFDRIVSQNERYKITEKKAVEIVREMLTALKYCHDKGIIHRDLKPENFIFKSKDPNSTVVLIDFGCAREITDDEIINDVLGTAYYMAPELAIAALENYSKNGRKLADKNLLNKFKSSPRTGAILKASDVWSIGVIAYVMMTGQAPFRGHNNIGIFESIVKRRLLFPKNDARYHNKLELNAHFIDFVRKVLVKDPLKRLSIEDCLAHPWVKGVDAKDYELNRDVLKYLKQFSQQSRLKKEITRVLAVNMTEDVNKSVFKHFERIDSDNDGFLNIEELTLLLIDQGYSKHDASKQSSDIISAADTDNDGKLSYEEFKKVWYRKVLSNNDAYIHRVFDVFDNNGDGFIDANELNEILFPKDDIEFEDDGNGNEDEKDDNNNNNDDGNDDIDGIDENQLQRLKTLIEEVDQDGDNRISFEEFKSAMKEDIDNNRFNARSHSFGGFVGEKYGNEHH